MNEFDINKTLDFLSIKRPIFHNEADFQFSLAWELQKQEPNFEIRLEYNVPEFNKRYIDIWIKNHNPVAIELKYKTSKIKTKNNDETFDLSQHGAQPLGRYDFLKDVQRLEEIIIQHSNVVGYVIFITNDSSYWQPSQKHNSVDTAFKIHQGQKINGELSWSPETGSNTKKNREKSIRITGEYRADWKRYSNLGHNGEFRMLCLQILP